MIKFFYGISGTFKSTTIKTLLKPEDTVVWSMIKYWKQLENGIYTGMLERNDLAYALLHLTNLKHTINTTSHNTNILVERGVSDMLFYRSRNYNLPAETINASIEEELRLCEDRKVEKILLIQEDTDWIRDVILSEPTRREVFPAGLDDYLYQQERYIEFTQLHNEITEVVRIGNAKEYLEKIGVEIKENLIK